jgi:endonuclease/exonuclease/phosphatase family metal-dependent hydrolase
MQPVSPVPVNAEYSCDARHAGEGNAVRWFGPERDPDRRSLAEWCSAVGPVVLKPEPASGVSAPPADSILTVVTWNMHVGGGDLVSFLQSELGYECDAGQTPTPRRHFVLLAQEAFRASDEVPDAPEGAPAPTRIAEDPPHGPRLDIIQVSERCGLALFYAPSMRNGQGDEGHAREDRGSAILSTLPLMEPVAIELPLEAQRRVTLVATVQAPAGSSRLRVASVHYDVAGNILRVLGTGGSMRVRQNDGLTETLDSLDPERALPIVVAGDLNTWSSRETVVLRMLETYPESPSPGREKTRGHWPPDHMFFRAGEGAIELVEGSYRVVEDAYGSDHRARLAAFRFR